MGNWIVEPPVTHAPIFGILSKFYMKKYKKKTWSSWRGVDPTNHSWHHLLASLTVIVWKMMDQNLYLNIIPSDFMAGIERKGWCDQELSLGHGLRNWSRTHNLTRMTTTTWHLSFQEETNKTKWLHRGWGSSASNKMVSHVNLRVWNRTSKVGWKIESVVIFPTFSAFVLLVQDLWCLQGSLSKVS